MERHEIAPRRKALDWSQKKLGVAVGMPEGTAKVQVSRIEAIPTSYVSPERLAAIDSVLTKEETTRKQFAAFQAAISGN